MFGSDIRDYQLNSVLTQCCGGVAVVYTGSHKPSGLTIAIKRFYLDRAKESANLIQQEILTTRQLQHPNILPYYSTFVNGLDLYIVSPLMTYGSCRDLINKYFNEGLPESASCIILRDTLQGLDYIHKKGYIHRGIRSSHILVSSSGEVCLSGLRSAGSLLLQGKRQKALHCLPPPCHNNSSLIWLSPELLEQNLSGYDEKSDIYSVGMVACELANGAIPFSDIPTTLMLTEKVRGHTPQLLDCTTFSHINFQDDLEVHGDHPLTHTNSFPLPESSSSSCFIPPEHLAIYHPSIPHNLLEKLNQNVDSGVGDSVASGSALHMRQVYATRKLTDSFHDFAELCLQREPNTRPTPAHLLHHSFFKQIRKSDSLAHLLQAAKPIEERTDNLPAVLLEDQLSDMTLDSSCEWDF